MAYIKRYYEDLCELINDKFINTDMTEYELKAICKKNKIDVENFLIFRGYDDFKSYIQDLKDN